MTRPTYNIYRLGSERSCGFVNLVPKLRGEKQFSSCEQILQKNLVPVHMAAWALIECSHHAYVSTTEKSKISH